jgi:ribosomal protein S18 acetylase RimI-like enzyme
MPEILEKLYKVQKKDIQKAGAVLADAFQHDPLWKKILEGESDIEQKLHILFETPIRYCLRYGGVYATSENLEGICVWAPGSLSNMTIWRIIRSGAFLHSIKMAGLGKKMKSVFRQIEDDRKEYMKGRKFIYIMAIGVALKLQGQGFGGKLIRALIKKSDQDGIPLYLETETENNVKMYKGFGFKLIKKITLPVINLPMWEMVRESQGKGGLV